MPKHSPSHCCFIIPKKMLLQVGDIESALESERLRGHRTASHSMQFAALPTGTKRRTIYDAKHTKKLPGTLVRSEEAVASKDAAVNQAYESSGATYDFYLQVLHRNSIDSKGMRLDSTVHFSRQFNNAFWNGQQMVYGDGDGKNFLNFASAIDVVAHELTHGVTQYCVPGGLDYQDQSGALNESISDVFGSVVKQWKKKQSVSKADWLIGDGIMGPAVGKALRSMKDPGNVKVTWAGDDQPKDMSGYVPGGDVHTNSGIPNHAFFLAATNLGGNSWDKAIQIWYRALSLLTHNATFKDAALATAQSAKLLGLSAADKDAVRAAWHSVKVI